MQTTRMETLRRKTVMKMEALRKRREATLSG